MTCLTVVAAVGATLGMALVLRGGSAVIWSKHQDAFPYIKGMLVIFLSWVCSPIASGDVAASDDHLQLLFPLLPPATACRTAAFGWWLLECPLRTRSNACNLAGIVCFGLFVSIRFIILRSPTGYKRAFWVSGNPHHQRCCFAFCCDFTQSELACSMPGEWRQVPQ